MAVESTTVRGLPDLKAALQSIPAKLRRRALRNALAAGARVVQRAARAQAPVLNPAARNPHRTSGLMRKAISVRTSKISRRAGDVGVFVNVRPAKRGQRGAKSRLDPFYWLFQNFGWTPGKRGARRTGRPIPGAHFLEAGARKLAEALSVFKEKIGPQIERLNGGKGVQL